MPNYRRSISPQQKFLEGWEEFHSMLSEIQIGAYYRLDENPEGEYYKKTIYKVVDKSQGELSSTGESILIQPTIICENVLSQYKYNENIVPIIDVKSNIMFPLVEYDPEFRVWIPMYKVGLFKIDKVELKKVLEEEIERRQSILEIEKAMKAYQEEQRRIRERQNALISDDEINDLLRKARSIR